MPKKNPPPPVWHSFCIMCQIKCHIETMTEPETLSCPLGKVEAEWYVAKVDKENKHDTKQS